MSISPELAKRLLVGMEHNRVFLAGPIKLNSKALATYDRDMAELREAVMTMNDQCFEYTETDKCGNGVGAIPLELDMPEIKATHVQTKFNERTTLRQVLLGWLGKLMS